MTRLLIVRHGSTDLMSRVLCGRLPGIPLSEGGRQEAQALGRKLATNRNLQAIYSSPLERAQETAQAIAQPHGLPVETVEPLTEIDFGEWTGKAIADLRAAAEWSDFNHCRSMTTPPGGESLLAVQSRAWKAVESLCTTHPDAEIALVSHGDVIRGLLLFLLGMPIDNIFRIEIAPASLSVASAGQGLAPIVHSLNQISSFEE